MSSTICIVGCGNIGSAFAKGLSLKALGMSLVDSEREKVIGLANDLGVRGSSKLEEGLRGATTVAICLKPHLVSQEFEKVAASLKDEEDKPLLVSFAAGLSYQELKEAVSKGAGVSVDSLGTEWRIARVMPNLAMAVGEGLSGVYSESQVAAVNANDLMNLVGKSVVLNSEEDFATITGLGGSGPAFVFEFMRSLAESSASLGLDSQLSKEAAIQMLLGAAKLAQESPLELSQLIDSVVTPGGTTAAGLAAMKEKGFGEAVDGALQAAAKRASDSLGEKK